MNRYYSPSEGISHLIMMYLLDTSPWLDKYRSPWRVISFCIVLSAELADLCWTYSSNLTPVKISSCLHFVSGFVFFYLLFTFIISWIFIFFFFLCTSCKLCAYTVSQKVDHYLSAITLSKANQFSKFFHHWKDE